MPNPQQPELARSRRTPGQDPDSVATLIEGSRPLPDEGGRGPVPPENQPGNHPATEQDKPDLNAFAERLGTRGDTAGSAPGAVGQDAAGQATPLRTLGRPPVVRAAAVLLSALAVFLLGRIVRRRLTTA